MPRKKQSPFLPDATFSFEDTAVLMFRTSYLNYQFVMEFNKAHTLALSRVEDIVLNEAEYPCFSYNDDYSHMAYVMIERSKVGTPDRVFDYYDKLLLVRGRDSWDFQQKLLDGMHQRGPEPSSADMLEHRRWVLSNNFNQGIFGIDSFGFSQRRGTSTSLYTGPAENMPKATATFLNRLHKFLETTFDILQWHLCEDIV